MENKINLYPNMDESAQNASQTNYTNGFNSSSIMQKILPMLLSGKTLSEVLPSMTNMPNMQNISPLLANVLSTSQSHEKSVKKIESDSIDVSHLTKLD